VNETVFLVPVIDVVTRVCETIAVTAPNECAAVHEVLRNAAHLRHTGGAIERVELSEQSCVKRDVWHERYRTSKLTEAVR
jgi:hypothetical protein